MHPKTVLDKISALLSPLKKKTNNTRVGRPRKVYKPRKTQPLNERFGNYQHKKQRGHKKQRKNNKGRAQYSLDDKMVKRDNEINIGKIGTGKTRGGHKKSAPFVPNHQNQNGLVFYNRNYVKGIRRAEKSQHYASPDNSSPRMSPEVHEKLETEFGKGIHLPVSIHMACNDATIDNPQKRTLLYEKAMLDFTRNLATGWYAGIRKSCIKFGPSAINDKYFVDQVVRTMTPGLSFEESAVRYKAYTNNHTLIINFLQNLLIANYNHIIGNDINKLLTRLPQHLAFALTVASRKFIMRVRNGVTNIATRIPSVLISVQGLQGAQDPCFYDDMDSPVFLNYIPPQTFIGGGIDSTSNLAILIGEVPGLVNLLYAVQQHEKYPYPTVDDIQTKLPNLTHYDSNGAAIKVELDIDEIVSVYGYSAVIGGSTYEGCYIHDLSGLEQTKISGVYRSIYFPQLRFDTDIDYSLIPDEFNDKLNTNYYFNTYDMAIYFGLTGMVTNVDYMLTAIMPYGYAEDDATTSENHETLIVNSKGLNYLTTKYDSNSTRPAPYKPTTRAVPTFPTVTFSPEPYNLAITMAQKMQNRYFDFTVQPMPITVTQLYTLSQSSDPLIQARNSPLLVSPRSFFSLQCEAVLTTAVWVIQYDGRFVLPSPIIEDFKPYNSYNTWTYRGGSQSIGVQLIQLNMAPRRGFLNTSAKSDPKPGTMRFTSPIWNLKYGAIPSQGETGNNFLRQVGNIQELYQRYGGITYYPPNFDSILETSNIALNEIRPYVKLNNCPEYETSLPSMHTLYVSDTVSGVASFSPNEALSIYTPLSADDYTSKNIAIFIKVALLPHLRIPEAINIPMLNATNVPNTLFGKPEYQERALFNLYQYSFVANYTGQSSELDYYYEQLRRHMVGSWSDLIPMFQQLAGGLMSGGDSPFANVMGMMMPSGKKQQPGANGDLMSMLNTILGSVGNYDEEGSNTVNTPKNKRGNNKKKSGGGDLLGTLANTALKFAPMLLEML